MSERQQVTARQLVDDTIELCDAAKKAFTTDAVLGALVRTNELLTAAENHDAKVRRLVAAADEWCEWFDECAHLFGLNEDEGATAAMEQLRAALGAWKEKRNE